MSNSTPTPDEKRLLGERIRKLRIQRELTQADLAGEEVSPAYISRIEAGERTPSPRLLRSIAETLGTSPDELRAEIDVDALAHAIADAAVKWIQDPADVDAYSDFVDATQAWINPGSDLRRRQERRLAATQRVQDSLDEAAAAFRALHSE